LQRVVVERQIAAPEIQKKRQLRTRI